jgi:hypothetical protein
MRTRRSLVSLLGALVLLAGPVPGVGATEQWCETDPLVVITTPGGSVVPVYVTNRARGAEYLPAVVAASVNYTVKSAGDGTLVKLYVTIPATPGLTDAGSTASTGPLATGTVYATTTGSTGQRMTLEFKLGVR